MWTKLLATGLVLIGTSAAAFAGGDRYRGDGYRGGYDRGDRYSNHGSNDRRGGSRWGVGFGYSSGGSYRGDQVSVGFRYSSGGRSYDNCAPRYAGYGYNAYRAPVYVQPAPVYIERPVYVSPPVIYYPPAPVYIAPPVQYYDNSCNTGTYSRGGGSYYYYGR